MRKLIVSLFTSLDGVVQAPGGPNEDPAGGFRLGGWTVPYADDIIGRHVRDLMAAPFELLLGRRTYDIFAGYWPHVPAGSGSRALADRLNSCLLYTSSSCPGSEKFRPLSRWPTSAPPCMRQ